MSLHPTRVEPYLPYMSVTSKEFEREVDDEWLEEYKDSRSVIQFIKENKYDY